MSKFLPSTASRAPSSAVLTVTRAQDVCSSFGRSTSCDNSGARVTTDNLNATFGGHWNLYDAFMVQQHENVVS